jgi:hypothetical protein
MAKKPELAWEGFRFPARLLTEEELDILSPRCSRCGLPAYVTELQQPLTEQLAKTPLVEITNGTLQFYCAHHSPIEVDASVTELSDLDFYRLVRVPVPCPLKSFERYACNCLATQPRCLKKCGPVRNLVGDVDLKEAGHIARAGREHEKRM